MNPKNATNSSQAKASTTEDPDTGKPQIRVGAEGAECPAFWPREGEKNAYAYYSSDNLRFHKGLRAPRGLLPAALNSVKGGLKFDTNEHRYQREKNENIQS